MFRNTFLRDIIDVKHYQKLIQIKVSVYLEIAKRIDRQIKEFNKF
jgi:hypothetical protein